MLEKPGIVTVFFGDGAACEGVFHESLNLAAMWNLPILYVCENNEWQAFVSRQEAMASSVTAHAGAFRIPAGTVDGNDVLGVHAATVEAVQAIRATRRPYLLELSTYRLRGHFEPDDQAYVDRAELAYRRSRDPIPALVDRLMAEGRLSNFDYAQLQKRVASQIETAAHFAAASPMPSVTELLTDVYA
jgi:pyruvate dehydrogenase E1 component alpha subunit